MSEDRFSFDFDEARQSEARVRVYVDEVERVFKKLMNSVDESSAWWTGPSRDAFVICANEFLELKNNVVNVITVMADGMRKTMEDKERHEEETVGFINSRTDTLDIFRGKTATAAVLNEDDYMFSKPALPMSIKELWEMFARANKNSDDNAGADEADDAETSEQGIITSALASLGVFLGMQINSFMQNLYQDAEMLCKWIEGREERHQKAVEKALAYMIDDDGSYDYDGISETLRKDSNRISGAEYFALATVFVTMDTADMEYFLRKLAHKTADNVFSSIIQPRHSEWEFDPVKVNAIIEHVEAMANSAALLGLSLSEMGDDEVRELYEAIFPGQQHDDTVNNMKNALWNEFADRRRDLVEKITILSVVRDLSESPGANEAVLGYCNEYGVITGEAGASIPNLSLSFEDGNYLLKFTNIKARTNNTYSDHSLLLARGDPWNKNVVTISKTMSGVRVISAISGNAMNYYIGKISLNVNGEVLNAAVALVGSKVASKVMKEVSSLTLITSLPKEVAKIIKKIEDAERMIRDLGNSMKAFEDGQYIGYMEFDAVVVDDGTSKQVIIINPGPETFEILQRLNNFISTGQMDISKYGLTYPITMEDAISNADAVRELIESLSENEWTAIRSPRDFQ